MKLSVIIPVFNEVQSIAEIIQRVHAVPLPHEITVTEIIAIDDCSTDGTGELLWRLQSYCSHLKVVVHEKNRGKGAALRTGIALAAGDLIIFQDADLEYDPTDYIQILRPIIAGKADTVYGSRFITTAERRVLYFWHFVGNKWLTLLCNMVSNINLTDMETGYKAFRREVLQDLVIEQDRFGCEPEITIKVAKNGWRIYEVGISYSGRTYEEGKKIGWRDAIQAVWCIVKYGYTVPRKHHKSIGMFLLPSVSVPCVCPRARGEHGGDPAISNPPMGSQEAPPQLQ
jgi:glycosyltransferase involved in cell wall biosynthesis